jgi:hypothetical protein
MKKGVVSARSLCRLTEAALLVAAVSLAVPSSSPAQIDAVRDQKMKRAAEETAQRVQEQLARKLGESILDLREALASRALDPGFRETVKRRLLEVPVETLRQIELSGAEGDLRAAISASGAPDSTWASTEDEDLLLLPTRVAEPNAVSGVTQAAHAFVPIPPCRIVDTRLSAEGALVPGVPRSFVVSGSDATLFGAQGGNASGCGIPTGTAVAAFVNFVAVSPAGPGNLRAWAYEATPAPQPTASIINYAAVPGALNIANGVTAPLCDPLATTCTYDVLVQANVSSVHVVADVLGYFRPVPTSFTTIGRSAATVPVGASCTHYSGAVVGVDVPAPGKILVRANVQLLITHSSAMSDFVYVGIGEGPTDCSASLGDATYVSMYPEPSGTYYPTVPVSRLFTASTPGTYFYYVNGYATSPYELDFWFAGVQATYHPD